MSARRDHGWLADLAVAAGRLDAAARPDLRAATAAEAWSRVAQAAGLEAEALAALVAARHGLPVADGDGPQPGLAGRLPQRLCAERDLCAWRETPQGLLVATADPTGADLAALVQFAAGVPVRFAVAPPQRLQGAPAPADGGGTDAVPAAHSPLLDLDQPDDGEPAVVRLCNRMLREAVARGASDVHVQPHGSGGAVRLRIDGMLRRVAALPRPVMLRVVARLKLLAEMDPTDQMRPQDGRLQLHCARRRFDLRLSTVPVAGAEKLVVRLLGSGAIRSLREVGIGQPELDQLAALLGRGQGLVLVTGPTGSGKSTTLYSALAERNDPAVNIATVEDPVEIRLPWLAQIEVNPKADLTFASALRSVLRQDPDIVLIGEIRDEETARIAVQAALTGHLVLATLHTNDALGAVPRLLDLGVSRQLLGQSLAGASAQRLARRLCPSCAQDDPGDAEPARWLATHAAVPRLRRAVGCAECGGTGYRGRLPICQVFEWSPAMAAALEAGESVARLRELAGSSGLRTLAESAADRLRAGETSLAEVERVLGADFWIDLGRAHGVPPLRGPFVARADGGREPDAPLLVVAPPTPLRAQAVEALQRAGHVVQEADDAAAAQVRVTAGETYAAILVDLEGLDAAAVRILLGLRETLGAAATPILGLRGQHDDDAIDALLVDQPGVVLRRRPDDAAGLDALLQAAVRALDDAD